MPSAIAAKAPGLPPAPAAPPNTRSWWRSASVLTCALFAAILFNNSEAVFQTPFYEAGDFAANSLQVLKAKQFQETVGNYSRFGFHHPGPAFFYVFGWGEFLFFDAAPIVPTPFNGQVIALYALSAFFFAATLTVIAKRLGSASPWFMGLAFLLAAWHFGAVGKFYEFIPARFGFFSPWAPCFIVLPFLCFVVAAAAVAAGNGKDLPLMTLCGCFLIHGHVAMPLFVGPLTLLAYGLFWLDARRAGSRLWSVFPRAHWMAAATIALFALPIAIDFFTAHPSNLERIVEHLRTSYGQGKGLLRSTLYFLHFAAYAAYPSQQPIPAFETFDGAGLLSFFQLHWRACGLWLGAILSLAVLTKTELKKGPTRSRIGTFRRRMYLMLLAATALSLVWGCIQEGPMFDYNAFFNFAIYYGWLLLLALTAAVWIEDRFSRRSPPTGDSAAPSWPARVRLLAVVAIALAATAAFTHERRRFRARSDAEEQRHFAATIDRALSLDPVQPKYFNFDWQAGGETTGVALYLERRGIRWWVREDWPLFFGADHIINERRPDQPLPTASSSFWRLAQRSNPIATEGDSRAIVLPLTPEFDLVIHPGK
jgi:hypothetical protein